MELWEKLDKKFSSKKFGNIKLGNIEIHIRYFTIDKKTVFDAYAELKNSKVLSESFLGHPTFRDEDIVGVDTAHSFNEKQTEAEKLLSAINQLTFIIEKWKEAIGE
jgi:hypothetical protein